MLNALGYFLRNAKAKDIPVLHILESESFPMDEAASFASMLYRCNVANEFFYCFDSNAVVKNDLNIESPIGFINGTCSIENTIHDDSMSIHQVEGRNLVIHSVTISPDFRKKGLGSALLNDYVEKIKANRSVDKISLLSKAYLLSFYTSCGFQIDRVSDVHHGQDIWFELSLDVASLRLPDQLQIDAFSNGPFTGNPAAVVFEHRDDIWMQKIAEENNLAETSFLSSHEKSTNSFDLRWFTPVSEVELCGHATLAAAHALYSTKRVSRELPISFHTRHSGILIAESKENGFINLDFPSHPPKEVSPTFNEETSISKGFKFAKEDIVFLGRSPYDLVIEVLPQAFMKMRDLDFNSIAELGGRGVIITCLGGRHNSLALASPDHPVTNAQYDFVSRCFFPRYGINEDPVTGSAHCTLAPYWFEKLKPVMESENRAVMVAYQSSQRGGVLLLELKDGDRVILSGQCVTTITSKILV